MGAVGDLLDDHPLLIHDFQPDVLVLGQLEGDVRGLVHHWVGTYHEIVVGFFTLRLFKTNARAAAVGTEIIADVVGRQEPISAKCFQKTVRINICRLRIR